MFVNCRVAHPFVIFGTRCAKHQQISLYKLAHMIGLTACIVRREKGSRYR